MTCSHSPIAGIDYAADGVFDATAYPTMTHLRVTVQPAQGGGASDGTPGELPPVRTVTVPVHQIRNVASVVVGAGGRGAPAASGEGGGGVAACTVAAAPPRTSDGAAGWVRVAVYDCGCPVEPR